MAPSTCALRHSRWRISPDRTRWVHPLYPFFLPVKVLSRVFRGKFIAGLRRAFRQKRLHFHGPLAELEEPKRFASFLRTVFRQDWVVYAKPAFGGPTQVLRYLGRYTHRVAISNHRLLAFDGERVTFRWKDYAHGSKQRKMTLQSTEFLRRFAQHILPRGFVRIRQYGFLANRCRAANLALARQLLAITPKAPELYSETTGDLATWRCPRCGAAMQIGTKLTARELANQCKFFDSS
jgi:Putative transposase